MARKSFAARMVERLKTPADLEAFLERVSTPLPDWRTPEQKAESLAYAAASRSGTQYVSCYKGYGVVRSVVNAKDWHNKNYKRARIWVVKDRRGRWLKKPFWFEQNAEYLTSVEPWWDPESPYSYSAPHAVLRSWRADKYRTVFWRQYNGELRKRLRVNAPR